MDYFVGIDGCDLAVCGLRQKYVRQQLMLYNTFANKLSGYRDYCKFVPDNQKFITSLKVISLKKIVPKEYHYLLEEKSGDKSNAYGALARLYSTNREKHKEWWSKRNQAFSLIVKDIKDPITVTRSSWGGKITEKGNPHGGMIFHVGRLAPYNHAFMNDAEARIVFEQNLIKVFGVNR
ncbi:MAG: hypothetical protein HOP07_10315 [Bacteriovoracaceae bacterium]|nr:hypothetical protein [Bacteriovoracaceae bacterium]